MNHIKKFEAKNNLPDVDNEWEKMSYNDSYLIIDKNGRIMAEINPSLAVSKEEMNSNIKLIENSPLMLELLKECLTKMKDNDDFATLSRRIKTFFMSTKL